MLMTEFLDKNYINKLKIETFYPRTDYRCYNFFMKISPSTFKDLEAKCQLEFLKVLQLVQFYST